MVCVIYDRGFFEITLLPLTMFGSKVSKRLLIVLFPNLVFILYSSFFIVATYLEIFENEIVLYHLLLIVKQKQLILIFNKFMIEFKASFSDLETDLKMIFEDAERENEHWSRHGYTSQMMQHDTTTKGLSSSEFEVTQPETHKIYENSVINEIPHLIRKRRSNKRKEVDEKIDEQDNEIIDDDEVRLVKYLLDDYNKEVRPVLNKSHAVQVVFGLAYTQLLDLVRWYF